jgi:hypothetical protein
MVVKSYLLLRQKNTRKLQMRGKSNLEIFGPKKDEVSEQFHTGRAQSSFATFKA